MNPEISTRPDTAGIPAVADGGDGGDGGSVVSLLERAGSVVVPIAVGLYALLYFGVEQVYGAFNVTPEQVGIDQATMFGRLMATIILGVLAGALLVGVVVGIAWLIDKITLGYAGRGVRYIRQRPWLAAAVGAVWCGATYWGFLGYLGADAASNALRTVLVATIIGVLAFLVPFRLLRRRPVGRAGMKIAVGALTGIGLGFLLVGHMEDSAVRVAKTGEESFTLSLLGFQDQWVIPFENESGKPLRDGGKVMLLGEADGVYTFYDCRAAETFRVPAEATGIKAISLQPDAKERVCAAR
ncbi:hypothetical protein AB0K60_17565 [Thermopolyspora sp. NPDC052614]|uniref:hypothetical protein n=1 Tax=Thermopolyspora sp. NPDC052614 TaxID=3155682 RepID=UPI00342B9C37